MRTSLYAVLALVAALGLASFALGQELPTNLSPLERSAIDGLNARGALLEAHRRALLAEEAALRSDVAAVVSEIRANHLTAETVAVTSSSR